MKVFWVAGDEEVLTVVDGVIEIVVPPRTSHPLRTLTPEQRLQVEALVRQAVTARRLTWLPGDTESARHACGCPIMDDWTWLDPCPGHVWTHWHPHMLDALAELRFCFYCGVMETQRLEAKT